MEGQVDAIHCIVAVIAALIIGAFLGAIPKGGIKNSAFGEIFCDINGEISSTRIMSVLSVLGGLGFMGIDPGQAKELATPLAVLFGGAFGGKAMQRHFEKRKDPDT